MSGPVEVFIGAPPDGLDAESQMVIAHSLKSRSSLPVQIIWMQRSDNPASFWSGWDLTGCATPFTPFRYAVPYVCGFAGRAIYCDCDQIFLGDVAELWDLELEPGEVLAARGGGSWRFDVCLFDCAAVKRHMLPLDRLKRADGFKRQNAYFTRRPEIVRSLGWKWNYLDSDTTPLGEAKILHYSRLDVQPHRKLALARLKREGRQHWYKGPSRPHPRREIQELFEKEYQAAWDAGLRPEQFYRDGC